jgi:type II secretory pathway pseudopilin PulG
MSMTFVRNQRGFTLAELMVATMITMLVLGGAVALTSQVQQSFVRQIEDSAGEQEGRYALEWVSRLIRAAGNNPFNLDTDGPAGPSNCPVPGTPYDWVMMDPDADGVDNDIRLQTDSNPPDGILGGVACDQPNEDVTVSYDPVTKSITFLDNNIGGDATVRTDAVIEDLRFIYRNDTRKITTEAIQVMYVETQITVRTRRVNPATGLPETRVLTQEVRLRGRGF